MEKPETVALRKPMKFRLVLEIVLYISLVHILKRRLQVEEGPPSPIPAKKRRKPITAGLVATEFRAVKTVIIDIVNTSVFFLPM